MAQIQIPEVVLKNIERHARYFRGKEIYGWLIGYELEDNVKVFFSIPCKSYSRQNIVSAEPSIEEVHELSKIIPKGIGVIGIYHSHPNEVFHSKTDDETVKQFISLYPNFVSIVTNGKVTKVFQLIDDSIDEVKPEIVKFKDNIRDLIGLTFALNITVIVEQDELFTAAYISSKMRELIEKNADELKINIKKKEIKQNEKIKKFKEKILHLSVAESNITNNSNSSPSAANLSSNTHIVKITPRFVVFTSKNKTFFDIKNAILTGMKDAMYYYLKHAIIDKNLLSAPEQIMLKLNKIPMIFNVKLTKNDIISFLDILNFRVEYMSMKNKKERKSLISKILKCGNSIEELHTGDSTISTRYRNVLQKELK